MSEGLVDPDSISSVDLIHMFYQMSYNGDLTLLSKFKKYNLPPVWNGLFTLMFKSFSKRIASSDNASKLFTTIIYGLYHDINLDYDSIMWEQLIQSTYSTTIILKFPMLGSGPLSSKEPWFTLRFLLLMMLLLLRFRSYRRQHLRCPISSVSLDRFQRSCS